MTIDNEFLKIPKIFKSVISQVLNLELIEMKGDAKRPVLPFATYEVINPYLPQSQNHSPADGFSLQIQLGFHGMQPSSSLQMALDLRAALERSSIHDLLENSGIYIEKILDVYSRPTLIVGEDYEYVSGIDLQLGMSVKQQPDDAPSIEGVAINSPAGNTIKI